jgi:hypothetical protein
MVDATERMADATERMADATERMASAIRISLARSIRGPATGENGAGP